MRCGCMRRRRMRFSARRGRHSRLFRLLTPAHEYEDNYDDEQEEPDEKQEAHHSANQPHRNSRLLAAFSLRLLTALDQPVDLGVLWKKPLDLFELWNGRRVLVGPVIVEALTKGRVGWTFLIFSAGGLHKIGRASCREW